MQRFKRTIVGMCAGLALLAFSMTVPVKAQPHPNYLVALSELRTARDYLQYDKNAPGGDARHHAVDEINKAIDEIKHAAWDDGKNTQFAPPARGVTNGWAPVHMAQKFLAGARTHIEIGVDNPENTGLRERIVAHLNSADSALHVLLYDMHLP